jgi:hypothetical protein
MKKQILIGLILLSSILTKSLAQTPVNCQGVSNFNSLYTGQQGASLITGSFQAANAPQGGSTSNYFNVWYQNFLETQVSSSVAIGCDNTLYSRLYWYGTWTGWNKYWHSGNLNNSSSDFSAKNLYAYGAIGIAPALAEANILTEGLAVSRAGYVNQKAIFNYSGGTLNIIAHDIQNNTGYINLQTWNGTSDVSRFFIRTDGNIGIGTSEPGFKLDVCGTIRAKEVKVDLTGNCVPDFVFKTDYKLMDLKTLESFVTTNLHLPEIASEKEMVENGVNMKEMQMKLLLKIEELTLYTIDQNKKLEAQNKKIQALEEKIEKIESTSK